MCEKEASSCIVRVSISLYNRLRKVVKYNIFVYKLFKYHNLPQNVYDELDDLYSNAKYYLDLKLMQQA